MAEDSGTAAPPGGAFLARQRREWIDHQQWGIAQPIYTERSQIPGDHVGLTFRTREAAEAELASWDEKPRRRARIVSRNVSGWEYTP